jgi:hypothetical protein
MEKTGTFAMIPNISVSVWPPLVTSCVGQVGLTEYYGWTNR